MEEENKFKTIAIKIWPTIYRIINSFIYFILSLIKTIVSIAINQLKGGERRMKKAIFSSEEEEIAKALEAIQKNLSARLLPIERFMP